jgi:predicted ribosomally synthesized peptide with nif11-like leader
VSVQTALHFIQRARRDTPLQAAIAALGDEPTLEDIVRVAAAAGFEFTARDLQRAHGHDWAMRWARYHHDAAADPG